MEIAYSGAVRQCHNAGSWLIVQDNEEPSREVCTTFPRAIIPTFNSLGGRPHSDRLLSAASHPSAAVQSPCWMLQMKTLPGTTTHPSNDQSRPGHKRCTKRQLQNSLAERTVWIFTHAGLSLYSAHGGLKRARESHVLFSFSPSTNYMNQSKEKRRLKRI